MKTAVWILCGTWLTGATGPEFQLCSALCLGTHRAACNLSHMLVAWPQEPVSPLQDSAGSPSYQQERPFHGLLG